MTHIITLFTLIVSRASKPLRGRLNHHVTMMGNQVMMTVIHTHVRRFLANNFFIHRGNAPEDGEASHQVVLYGIASRCTAGGNS